MLSMFARKWWAVALQGLVAIVFGLLALVWPGPTLQALVILFGAFMLGSGILALIEGIDARWTPVTLAGGTGIVVGMVTLIWPNVTGLVLLYLIAAWTIITGALEIVAATELRRVIGGEWLMLLEGVMSVLLGAALVVFPSAGAVGLAWLIGAYAILDGILLIVLAFRMRSWMKDTGEVTIIEDAAR
jgi:uncharacterized membrane protein HdeD (DUF308 family)